MSTEAPVKGMWVVSSDAAITPKLMQHAKAALESAADSGQQVVVVQGIEFRWRPTPIDTSPLDVERLAEAMWAERDRLDAGIDGANEVLYRRAARAILARLSEPSDV